MGFIIFVLVVAGVFCLWGVINPRSVWEKTASWQFKNKEANEPSDSGFAVQRFAYGFSLVACIVMIPVLSSAMSAAEEESKQDAYDSCLLEHQGDDSLLTAEEWCENLEPGA